MKRAHILFAALVLLAFVGYQPMMTLIRRATEGRLTASGLMCDYEGRSYAEGQQRRADDGCNVCTCGENGWACTKIACQAGQGSGTISGKLSYPSERIPAQRICAVNLADDEKYCQQTVDDASTYAIIAPAGDYWVYATLPDDLTGKRAYWSEYVRCGITVDCKDHTPVKVKLETGATAQADPQDWYAAGQIDDLIVTPSRYEYNTHNYYPTSVFRVATRGLAKLELYASPYPPDEATRYDPPFTLIGEASLIKEDRGAQTWTLPVPAGFQAMEVRPKGYWNDEFVWGRDLRIVRPIVTAAASSTVEQENPGP